MTSMRRAIGPAILLAGLGCATAPRPAARDTLVAAAGDMAAASLSDAVDQVVGKRGFLSHGIRRMTPGKRCGRAVTVLARPAPAGEKAPPTLALETIDEAEPGSVIVIVMEGPEGADVAALGGIIVDALDLEAVAETAAKLNRWEFMVVGAPPRVQGATGSLINLTAVF